MGMRSIRRRRMAGRTAHPRAFGSRRPGSPLLCGTAAAGLALRRARRAPCSAQAQGADGLSGRGIPPFFRALYGRPVPAAVFACVWRKCERTGRSLTWT